MDANNVPLYSANMNDHSLNGSATYSLQPTGLMQQQQQQQQHHHHHHLHQQQQHQPPLQLYQNQAPNTENPRTLYVGNLDPSITEEFIRTLFEAFGKIINLKLMNDNQNEHYCFIEYEEPSNAATAILTMNKRKCYEREIKVNWASSCGGIGTKPDTSRHFHIFVGDLSTEIETQQLREAFSPFGEISDCRVVRDLNTFKSKGYGFVSFVKKQDAENAIANMNGQWIGHRAIRTNWAARKMPTLKNENNVTIGPSFGNRSLNYEEIYNQSSLTNCTVYCGGLMNGLSEDIIQKAFGRFGPIQEIRVFKEKGYAFIKFTSKEAATNAIVTMHNQDILGQTVKCSWGKETNDSNISMLPSSLSAVSAANPARQTAVTAAAAASLASNLSSPSLIYQYNQQQLSYWYPSYNAAGMQANQAPPTQYGPPVQAGLQYHQFNQYYPHGAQAGAVSTSQQQQQQQQSSNAYDTTSLGMPISGWNHHQGHHQLSNNNNANMPTSHISVPIHQPTSTLQPQTVINHYSLQGYQAQ